MKKEEVNMKKLKEEKNSKKKRICGEFYKGSEI